MQIRLATTDDFSDIWPIFKEIVHAGETYTFPTDCDQQQAFHLWMELPQQTFIAKDGKHTLGSYYLKPNQAGPGDHVCNCGYMVATSARGKGVATTLCEHSKQTARALGFLAMQFKEPLI